MDCSGKPFYLYQTSTTLKQVSRVLILMDEQKYNIHHRGEFGFYNGFISNTVFNSYGNPYGKDSSKHLVELSGFYVVIDTSC